MVVHQDDMHTNISNSDQRDKTWEADIKFIKTVKLNKSPPSYRHLPKDCQMHI